MLYSATMLSVILRLHVSQWKQYCSRYGGPKREMCQLGYTVFADHIRITSFARTQRRLPVVNQQQKHRADLTRARARCRGEDRRKIAALLASSCSCTRGDLEFTARRARSILRVAQRSNELVRLADGTNYYRYCAPQIAAEVASDSALLAPVVSSSPTTRRTRRTRTTTTTNVVYR